MFSPPPCAGCWLKKSYFLPQLEVQTHNVSLTTLEKAEVLENTAGTLIKIFFAFFWQESIIDLGGEF